MQERGFDKFFPTSCLVTGFDIIFFWVARMMMMTLKATKQIPFKDIYIHAIVRDKLGRKMSKSLGNGIDPLEMIEKYGADALRFTLAAGSGYNRNLNLDPERIAGYRNFINKVWNAFRFVAPFLESAAGELPAELDHHERWIISELNETAKVMNESMDEYRFDDSCSAIYSFVYDRFCSWFIEVSKPVLYGDDEQRKTQRASVLKYGLKQIMALMHPFTPFMTEEIWSHLKEDSDDLLIVSEYPEWKEELNYPQDQKEMAQFIEVVTQIRNIRAANNIKPKDEITVELFTETPQLQEYFQRHQRAFADLTRLAELKVADKSAPRPKKSGVGITSHTEVFIPLEGLIDIEAQLAKLNKDLVKAEKEFNKVDKKLNNPKFTENAPAEVIAEVKEKASTFKAKIDAIKQSIERFS
jgi:valyl-tRNA synthetase